MNSFDQEESPAAWGLMQEHFARAASPGYWREDCGNMLTGIADSFSSRLQIAGKAASDKAKFNMFLMITWSHALASRENKDLRIHAGIRRSWLFR